MMGKGMRAYDATGMKHAGSCLDSLSGSLVIELKCRPQWV